MFDRLSIYSPQALGVLRIMTALLFIAHGTQKLFGFPVPAMGPTEGLMLIGGLLEVFGGLAVLVGFFTRPVSFVLSGMMAVGYFMFHFPASFFPQANGGDGAVLFCFIFLYFVFSGPGAWSVNKH